MGTFVNRDDEKDYFDLGVIYRTTKQLIGIIGIPLSENFKVGYSYAQTFAVGYNTNSTHEIVLDYRIPMRK